jgi:hypothetical protein
MSAIVAGCVCSCGYVCAQSRQSRRASKISFAVPSNSHTEKHIAPHFQKRGKGACATGGAKAPSQPVVGWRSVVAHTT